MPAASKGLFETATREAILEIIRSHGQQSRFGLILSHESLNNLTDDLFSLLLTSRNLKTAGDRFLGGSTDSSAASGKKTRPIRA